MQSPQKSNEPRKRTRTRGGRKNREKTLQKSCKNEGMLFGKLDPVPYDKNIDAPPGACLNCRSFRHKHKDCENPKTHDYCCNCGRRGVAVDECPRCARSFHAQDRIMKSWIYERFFDDEPGCEEQTLEEKETFAEDVYVDSRDRASMENLVESRLDSLDENSIASKGKEEPKPSTGDRITEEYLSLFGAIKHLSIDAQNFIAMQFVAERKKQSDEMEAQLGNGSELEVVDIMRFF